MVPASDFLSRFASDRRHMRKKEDGTWIKNPPPYPTIQPASSSSAQAGGGSATQHNLDEFISMDAAVGVGDVMPLMDFVKRFYRN